MPIAGTTLEEDKALDLRVEGPYVPSESGYVDADHIICVVGGTGITGAISLATWWLNSRSYHDNAHFTLIWTVREHDTAMLQEWSDLESRCQELRNINLQVHVSSESGRLDVHQTLRKLTADERKGESTISRRAWVYVSGPAGLLNQAEDACVDIAADLRRSKKSSTESKHGATALDYYIARWEV